MRGERIHAVDALRVYAMISVVFLHASISYMTVRMPDLLWAVRDAGAVPFFDWLFFWIRGLTMRVFFLVAGFFAAKLYADLGERGFLENRGRRILIPFLVGTGILLPLVYFVWCYGWVQTGQCDLGQILRMQFDAGIQRNLFGPAHLWFLEFLLVYYAAFLAWRKWGPVAAAENKLIARLLFSPWRPFLLAIPNILILGLDVDVVINFHNTFVPNPLKLLYYGVFFLAGAWLYPYRERLREYASLAWVYLGASVPVFVWMAELTRRHVEAPLVGWERFALVVSICLFSWLSVFAFFGIFVRHLNRERPLVRYLSGASYWVYLCHFPVVGVMQVVLWPFAWPAALKFSAVVLTALAFGFLSYEWFVRSTLVGACLNGPGPRAGRGPAPLGFGPRVGLSLFVALVIFVGGASFQNYYRAEKNRYETAITGYYWKYLGRAPDPIGLKHWTDWALDRWGLVRVEEEGFIGSEEHQAFVRGR